MPAIFLQAQQPGHQGHFTGDGLRLDVDTCICWPLGASIFGGWALGASGKLLVGKEGRGGVFSDGRFFFVKNEDVCFF